MRIPLHHLDYIYMYTCTLQRPSELRKNTYRDYCLMINFPLVSTRCCLGMRLFSLLDDPIQVKSKKLEKKAKTYVFITRAQSWKCCASSIATLVRRKNLDPGKVTNEKQIIC